MDWKKWALDRLHEIFLIITVCTIFFVEMCILHEVI